MFLLFNIIVNYPNSSFYYYNYYYPCHNEMPNSKINSLIFFPSYAYIFVMGFVKSSLTLAFIHLCSEIQYQQKQILERGGKKETKGKKTTWEP